MKQLENRSNKEIEKKRLIKDLLNANSYVPRQQTIKSLILNDEDTKKYNFGISNRTNPEFYDADETMYSSKYNKVFQTIIDDLEHIRNEYFLIDNELEDNYRNYVNKSNRFVNALNKLEHEINLQLLLTNSSDPFQFGVVEDFNDLKFVIENKTDAVIYDGKVFCKQTAVKINNSNNYKIDADCVSRSNSITFKSGLQNIFDLKKLDKNGYQHLCYSNNKNDIIDLIFNIEFNEKIDLDILRLDLLETSLNSKTLLSIFCLTEANVYEPIDDNNVVIKTGTNLFHINKKQIKFLKIILTKTSYDEQINLEYLYKFNIDYISFDTMSFDTESESTVYLGPYLINDLENNPVNFSYASIKGGTCCTIPDKTSIDFYLSKDEVNWKSVSFNDNSSTIVSFDNVKPEIIDLIDSSLSTYIIEEPDDMLKTIILENQQKFLNYYIQNINYNKYISDSAEIKRNIYNSPNQGWIQNSNFYTTTFFIEELEGKYLDFGPYNAFIDSKYVSGKVFLKYGYHKITTSHYKKISSSEFKNELELKNADSLYPYNHKYLIQGFNYSSDYIGRRVYLGAKENFGSLLKKVPLNYLKENPNSYDIYSEVEIDRNIFFVVNVNINDSTYSNETYDINVLSSDDSFDNNKLYIKAILKTQEQKITPTIDSIQVRVI